VLRGHPPALAVRDEPAGGDSEQRVMGIVVGGLGEEGLVGGDERQSEFSGQLHQGVVHRGLLRQSVLLEFQNAALDIIPDVRIIPQAHKALNVP